jgi:small subunit ribosomal protein S18
MASYGKNHNKKARPTFKRPKRCRFCAMQWTYIDYKNIDLLHRFVNDFQKIKKRKYSGLCDKHQRLVSTAIKNARNMALLRFV